VTFRRRADEGGWPLRDPTARLRGPRRADAEQLESEEHEEPAEGDGEAEVQAEAAPEPEEVAAEAPAETEIEPEVETEADDDLDEEVEPDAEDEIEETPEEEALPEHAVGELDIPEGYGVLEGAPTGRRRAVGVVVSRFNGEITNGLLRSALDALEEAGVVPNAVTVMPVPGAFELPLAAMALAKTRRYACIVALGCVIRGETPHFEYVAGEAASGLQLASLETGVPIAFGVLTTNTSEQAEARLDKGAEAVRTALEMADLFSQLRASAAAAVAGAR
jgi:6,7-dimethyl-8-ribityllumazine synthase